MTRREKRARRVAVAVALTCASASWTILTLLYQVYSYWSLTVQGVLIAMAATASGFASGPIQSAHGRRSPAPDDIRWVPLPDPSETEEATVALPMPRRRH